MNEFWLWFKIGVEHILDVKGYDHILFVSLLVVTFPFKNWKKLLVLITAFTLGHSVSLALSVTNIIHAKTELVEFLIGLSILFTAIYHLFTINKLDGKNRFSLYLIATCFGLIHGLGFSFLLKSLLGNAQGVILPLLYFNMGLEFGQIIIVIIVLGISLLLATLFKWPFKIYKLVLVCTIGLISLKISVERLLELFFPS